MSSIEIKSSLIENQFQLNFQVIIFKKKTNNIIKSQTIKFKILSF